MSASMITRAPRAQRDRDLSWMDAGACRGDAMFTELPVDDQVEICATCPAMVRIRCAEYGIAHNSVSEAREGPAYGGLFPEQLAELAARRAATILAAAS